MASPFGAWGGIGVTAGPGFSDFLRGRGYEAGSLIQLLPKLDIVQQVDLDRNLNLQAANPNDPRYPHYKGLLVNDANWKEKLKDVFLDRESDPRLIEELIKVVKRGIRSHEIQSNDQLGGSSLWNKTWIKVYENWLRELKKKLQENI